MKKKENASANDYYTDFPIESWDAINMFIRPSERIGGAEDVRGDLV